MCNTCTSELRELLLGMARGFHLGEGRWSRAWLAALEDAALGQTRLGESERFSSDRNSPLPFSESASLLMDNVHGMLTTWVRHVCESRGIPVSRAFAVTSARMSAWLSCHVDAIAQDEAAGEIYGDVEGAVEQIERVINRPVPDRYLGPCPVIGENNEVCNAQLTTSRDASNVECQRCHTLHSVTALHEAQMRTTDQMSFTISELYRLILPVMREYVPDRTLRHWRSTGALVPTGYDSDNEPRFLLADVRALRDKKTQRKATGAAARGTRA